MIDFPNAPTMGQVFNSGAGPIYQWDGTAWNLTPFTVLTAERKNRIVNGALQISQEIAPGGTNTTNHGYVADNWDSYWVTTGVTAQGHRQDNPTADTDVNWFFRFSCTTADTSLAATEYYTTVTRMEGQMVADFRWGTPQAVPAVFRLKARSVIAGTFGIRIAVPGTTAAYFVKACTITTPNVWTWFEFPVPPPTVGTAMTIDNGIGITINITAMSGSDYAGGTDGQWSTTSYLTTSAQTNWMSVANQYLEFTNVGLYRDPNNTGVAPPWETPDYGEELARCQRYYCKVNNIWQGNATSGSSYATNAYLPCHMRVAPTCSAVQSGSGSFPATPGTIAYGGYNAIQESRVASATATAYYASTITANARL